MANPETQKRKFEEMSSHTVDEKTNEDIASAIVETTRSLIMCLIYSVGANLERGAKKIQSGPPQDTLP